MQQYDEFNRYYLKPDPYRANTQFSEISRLRRAWEWVRARRYRSVLDIGAGEGIWTVKLAGVSDFVVASDISFVAIGRASRVGLSPIVLDLSNLCFATETFDLVCCMTALSYLPKNFRLPALDAIYQALVPEGILLLVDAVVPNRFVIGEMPDLWQRKFVIQKVAAGNVRIPLLGRLATQHPMIFGKIYERLTYLADRAPERLARHVMFWAQKR